MSSPTATHSYIPACHSTRALRESAQLPRGGLRPPMYFTSKLGSGLDVKPCSASLDLRAF